MVYTTYKNGDLGYGWVWFMVVLTTLPTMNWWIILNPWIIILNHRKMALDIHWRIRYPLVRESSLTPLRNPSGGRISVDALDQKGGRWMIWWVKLDGCIHKRYGSNGQKHSKHLKMYDTICWMSIHTGYQSALLWKQGFDAQPSFRGKGKNGGWVEIGVHSKTQISLGPRTHFSYK